MGEHDTIGPTELFVDDQRGTALRASWHPEAGVVVVSFWRDDRCVATFRLGTTDVARLSALLTQACVESLRLSLES